MDKVINGVDVSECIYYDDGTCCNKDVMSLSCENTDCIYKQLKRKEQECERLKEENYQLQKDCQICENFIDFIPCKPIRDMDYDLQKVINQRDNYQQTLQEIRDIAEKEIVCDNCNFEGTDKCDARMCTHFYLNDFSKDILDKINEVIGAE